MTRKDYKVLAEVIVRLKDRFVPNEYLELFADSLATALGYENPNFNQDKWNKYIWNRKEIKDER